MESFETANAGGRGLTIEDLREAQALVERLRPGWVDRPIPTPWGEFRPPALLTSDLRQLKAGVDSQEVELRISAGYGLEGYLIDPRTRCYGPGDFAGIPVLQVVGMPDGCSIYLEAIGTAKAVGPWPDEDLVALAGSAPILYAALVLGSEPPAEEKGFPQQYLAEFVEPREPRSRPCARDCC